MALKTADEMASSTDDFIARVGEAVTKFEALRDRLRSDATFRDLWERDSAQALREVGIDPEARQEVGYPPYDRGPECNNCITPQGNACHC